MVSSIINSIIIISNIVGIPAIYMAIVVPIGYLVGVDNIEGHTHYLYYTEATDRNSILTGYK